VEDVMLRTHHFVKRKTKHDGIVPEEGKSLE
jgi:hypothetical protein